MRVLKNILLIGVLILTTSFLPTEVTNKEIGINYTESQTYDVQQYIGWSPSGVGYWTQGRYYHVYNDFDWMLTRSVKSFDGYYYFDFWFFSQSYYWDGYSADYASTNIRNVKVYVDGKFYKSENSTLGITFFKTYNASSLRVITKNPRPIIYFKWGYMNAK